MQNIYFFIIAAFMLLAGCGDSGGGGIAATGGGSASTYRVTLATQVTSPSVPLLSIGATLQLPAGVIPKLAADGSVDSSVVKASGKLLLNNISSIYSIYTPANGASKGTLSFLITAVDGFVIGKSGDYDEFATVTLNISGLNLDFATINQNIANGTMLPVATLVSASTVDLESYNVVDNINIKISAAPL